MCEILYEIEIEIIHEEKLISFGCPMMENFVY